MLPILPISISFSKWLNLITLMTKKVEVLTVCDEEFNLLFKVGVMFDGAKGPSDETRKKYDEVLKWITNSVKSGFVASKDHMTLADLSFVATYSTLRATGSVDTRKFAFNEAWFKRCQQQIPDYHEACGRGADVFGDFYRAARAGLHVSSIQML